MRLRNKTRAAIDNAYSPAKVFGTSVIAFVLLLIIALLCWKMDDNANPPPSWIMNTAVAIFSVCVGWLVGAVISPYDNNEKTEFAGYVKVISSFLSGYLYQKQISSSTSISQT